jgi:hypothetical protein
MKAGVKRAAILAQPFDDIDRTLRYDLERGEEGN